jgi:hypothetical protein
MVLCRMVSLSDHSLVPGHLTKGAMTIPRISETMYAQTGRVTFSLVTTIIPRMKLNTSTPTYHVHGVSL